MGQCGEAAAFGVGQAQPAAVEVGFQDAIFLLQIGNNPLLVPLNPPDDHGDQEMEDHNRSSGWRPSRDRVGQYTPNLSYFNGIEAAEIFNHTC